PQAVAEYRVRQRSSHTLAEGLRSRRVCGRALGVTCAVLDLCKHAESTPGCARIRDAVRNSDRLRKRSCRLVASILQQKRRATQLERARLQLRRPVAARSRELLIRESEGAFGVAPCPRQ